MAEQETWTIQRMLDWTIGYLGRKGDKRPRLPAEWMLGSVTGLSRVQIYTSFDRPLTPDELRRMHDAVVRRASGAPLQYITGEMPFRHIVLQCVEGVLRPRPETEVLVDAALEGVDAARACGREARVLEVGTGTGCIACSIASERRGTHVVATDISPKAVSLAERNRDALGLDGAIDVVRCDLADGVDPSYMGALDVLVSNPPYIPSDVVPTLPAEVEAHEPHLALDGGPDGLDVFRRLLGLAPAALRPGGMMCVELFETNVGDAAELCRRQGGWASVEVRQDLTRRPRVLVAVREGDLAAMVDAQVERSRWTRPCRTPRPSGAGATSFSPGAWSWSPRTPCTVSAARRRPTTPVTRARLPSSTATLPRRCRGSWRTRRTSTALGATCRRGRTAWPSAGGQAPSRWW